MYETSKSIFNKLNDNRYVSRYLRGDGIDIGSGPDSIAQYHEFFPLMKSCRSWDMPDGDAEFLRTIDNNTFDFIHSSHCLEHLHNPVNALENWLRVLKPSGHLICIVPDEDLYEQGVFPSTFNRDHKHTFTIFKKTSWTTHSINITDMISDIRQNIEIKKIELLDATFRYDPNNISGRGRYDQTLTPIGECAIEFIIKKK